MEFLGKNTISKRPLQLALREKIAYLVYTDEAFLLRSSYLSVLKISVKA